MRFLIVLACFLFTNVCFSQYNERPYENPDNSLELKLSYHKTTSVNASNHGSYSTTDLFLKVDGEYLAKKDRGINEEAFRGFLSDCPEALELSLNSLSTYKKATKQKFICFVGGGGIMLSGIFLGTKTKSKTITIASLLAGYTTALVFWNKSDNTKNKAHDQVWKALELYSEHCYNEPEN